MKAPVLALNAARESRLARRINLQEKPSTTAATRQTRLLRAARNLQKIRSLGVFHGRLSPITGIQSGSATIGRAHGGRTIPLEAPCAFRRAVAAVLNTSRRGYDARLAPTRRIIR